RRVIEAPERPSLVVAGAGSGKTQTMVQRIVWLIARRGVDPAAILGLTFTRKAAGELRERVDAAVERLRQAGLVSADEAAAPEISTYNAFANRLFTEHALLVGQEPDAVVLEEVGAVRLMRRIVLRSDDEALAEMDLGVAEIAARALRLARGMRENRVDGARLLDFVHGLRGVGDLPGRRFKGELVPLNDVRHMLGALDRFAPLVRLAEAYDAEKRRLGVIEFADQVVSAVEVLERAPGVAEDLRARYRHVILDEYQDTSVGQIELLRGLFRGHSIMAVGDPKQSIYSWRGASASNMGRFHEHFGVGEPLRFHLSVSWRNDRAVLQAANALAKPIERGAGTEAGTGREPIPQLRPREDAGPGRVELVFAEHLDAEAQRVAEWFAELMPGSDRPPSAAILFRARRDMAVFADALRARGVPHRIVGLGGLLTTPEIVDLLSFLRVAQDPDAGSELIRLLAGSHCRLGLADIDALWCLARRLAELDWRHRRVEAAVSEARRGSIEGEDRPSLSEALDYLAAAGEGDPIEAGLTSAARERIVRLAGTLAELRSRLGLAPADLVESAIRLTGLDVEAAANPRRPTAPANLDAFLDAVLAFQRTQPGAGIGDLLSWLEIAAEEDALVEAPEASRPGVVQLLTVHGAKGLEWDLVAIPRMVDGGLPGSPKDGDGWLSRNALPYPLRLDAQDLPRLELAGAERQSEVKAALEGLKGEVRERFLAEERRLAYVAVTRARERLLLSGSFWRPDAAKPQNPSPYLL
ncbi:MAG: ATP-dependent helicase, partial [Pseudoclavibacter sp.]|nr:ATP-dependent helicase [Pseudoclavibacter sp.]